MPKGKSYDGTVQRVILFIAFTVVGILIGVGSLNKLHRTVTVEVGEGMPDVSKFIKSEDETGSFVSDLSKVDMSTPGVYNIEVQIAGRTYKSSLEVKDTIAPSGRAISQEIPLGRVLEAEDFVTDIVDATEVTVYFSREPDFDKIGAQDVEVVLEDEGRNTTILKTDLRILQDNEPPRIIGAHDCTVYIGERVSYRRDVTVTDNMDKDVKLFIDSSQVNLKREGSYEVVYTAEDVSGNRTAKAVIFTVVQRREEHIDKKELEPLLDEVLAEIITDGMTKAEIAEGIYNWTKHSISYIKQPDMDDWVTAAYYGIKNRRGDCFIYYSTAQALLTRAGIENQHIVKDGGGHHWSLVNLGDGWYHFDTTPRRGGGDFFMLTDAELEQYSKEHNNSHVWDRDRYPKTPLQWVQDE